MMIMKHRRRCVSGEVPDTLAFAHVCLMKYRHTALRRRVSDQVQMCIFADMCLMMQCPFRDGVLQCVGVAVC